MTDFLFGAVAVLIAVHLIGAVVFLSVAVHVGRRAGLWDNESFQSALRLLTFVPLWLVPLVAVFRMAWRGTLYEELATVAAGLRMIAAECESPAPPAPWTEGGGGDG